MEIYIYICDEDEIYIYVLNYILYICIYRGVKLHLQFFW